MRLNRFLMMIVATSLLVGCAKIKVVKVPEGTSTPANGVIYALPNTVVRVLAKMDKIERMGARYAMFAAIFAPHKKPVCEREDCTEENKKKYSLQQGAGFSTYGEPDPANVFLVKFTGGGTIDQSLTMSWNEAGLLSAASSSVTNRTVDVALSGLKLATSLGTKAALGAADVKAGVATCKKSPSNADGWIIPILQANGGASAPTLIANYCEIKKEDRDKFSDTPANRDLLTEATREYVNQVATLVGARTMILSGTSPSMEPATLLTRIEAEIDDRLTALYIGTKKTITWDGALDVRTIAAGTPIPVLRIDAENGICLVSGEVPPEAKPFPSEFAILSSEACLKATTVDMTLSYYPERSKQLFTKITDITTGDRSFRYRIPAQVRASLHDNRKTYGSGTFAVAQLGTIISLPASRQSKTLSYELAFIEATGGLKTFKLGTAGGLDASTIDALAGVGGTLLDARSAARKKDDELTVLTREFTLLKLRDDICTIQKKYGLPCTAQPE